MKRAPKILAIAIGTILLLEILSMALTTYDYGWKCTKCLRDSHVVERRFLGIPYWKTTKLRYEGFDLTGITGRPCDHVFRKGGFGSTIGDLFCRGTGCGITAEGAIFQYRWQALSATFSLYEEIHDVPLTRQTLQLIDSLLPPDATVAIYKSDTWPDSSSRLRLLSLGLETSQDSESWQAALTQAKEPMSHPK